MLHSSRIHVPTRARQRFAVRTIFPTTSFSPPDSKESLRRGILFSTVAAILLLVGCILTWLGFDDVFGGKISMTGPLLITLAVLMMLMSCRQVMLFRKRNRSSSSSTSERNLSGMTAVVVDRDDGNGAATIVLETYDEMPIVNRTSTQRVLDDLAPPAYTDITQLSCSSNCPSFISYDDRNEAPPTYEETCPGVVSFGSESSLSTTTHWRPSSSQLIHSTSPHLSHTGRFFSDNDKAFSQKCQSSGIPVSFQLKTSDALCSVKIMDPAYSNKSSSNSYIPSQSSLDFGVPGLVPVCSNTAKNIHVTRHSHIQTIGTGQPTTSWSRRSFSSIPSYTCLLSESGEVSAHVFNTSSIIEEMMPSSSNNPSDAATGGSPNLLVGAAPSRSHSMSSVHALRQGVPYDLLLQQQSPVVNPTNRGSNPIPQEHRLENRSTELSRCSQRSDPGVDAFRQMTTMSDLSQRDLQPGVSISSTHCTSAGSLNKRTVSPVMSRSMEEARPNVIFLPERRVSHQNIGVYIKHQDIQETI